ncbi:hypothetical protein BH10PSE12_BH10PSE12_18830 [soil metagenome]
MPRIETYGQARVAPASPTQARFQAADNGGGVLGAVAQGLQQAGAVIDNHTQFLAELKAQQAELEAKDADNALSEGINDLIDNPETGLSSKQGKDAVDAYEPTIQEIDRRRSELSSKLGTPLAKRMFDSVAGQRMLNAKSLVARKVAGEREKWRDQTSTSRIGLAVADAGNAYQNPAISDQHIATAVNELKEFGKRKGWSPETQAMETLKVVSDARRMAAGRLTAINSDLGQKYLDTYGAAGMKQLLPEHEDAIADDIRIKQAQIMAEQRRAQSEARQAQREDAALVGEQAHDVLEMIDGGYEVDGGSLGKLATRLDALGKPVLAIRLRTAGEVQAVVSQAKSWRPDQLQGWINTRRGATQGKATPTDAAQIDAAEKLLGKMRTGIQADPLSWAVEAGVTKLAPVDFKDARSVQARVTASLGVAEKYGIKPTFFTDEEAGMLGQQIKRSNAAGKVKLATQIVQGFGRYGRDVLGSLSGNDPIFAHAAGLATMGPGGADTAQRIFAGQEAWQQKTPIPSAQAFEATPTLGKALAFTPKTRNAMMASAKAIYAGEALAGGLDPKVLDEDVWSKAVNRAAGATYRQDGSRVGGIGTYRGNNIVLPPDVAPDDFASMVGRVNAADLKALGTPRYLNGKPADPAAVRNGYLFDAGAGKYFVSIDANGTQFLRGPKGHFILDMAALAPRLRGRKPDTALGRAADWLGF